MSGQETPYIIKTQYQPHIAVIRFCAPVENEAIFTLCEEIDLAVESYFYRDIEIQIDSVGGSVVALNYFLDRMSEWQARHITIAMTILTKAMSAAALLASMGSIGHRLARPGARLLYHTPRWILGEDTVLRADDMRESSAYLENLNTEMISRLATHIFENKVLAERSKSGRKFTWDRMMTVEHDGGTFEELKKGQPRATIGGKKLVKLVSGEAPHLGLDQVVNAYTALSRLDTTITAEMAVKMMLIDGLTPPPKSNTAQGKHFHRDDHKTYHKGQ